MKQCLNVARDLVKEELTIYSTPGTYTWLKEKMGVPAVRLNKISEGRPKRDRPSIKNKELALILNTPTRKGSGH